MLSSRKFLRHTMRFLHDSKRGSKPADCYLRLTRNKRNDSSLRTIRTASISSSNAEVENIDENAAEAGVSDEVRKKLIYCEYLDGKKLKKGYMKDKIITDINVKKNQRDSYQNQITTPVYSTFLEGLIRDGKLQSPEEERNFTEDESERKPVHMPYSGTNKYEEVEERETDLIDEKENSSIDNDLGKRLNEEYMALYDKYLESSGMKSSNMVEGYKKLSDSMEKDSNFRLTDNLSKVPPDWMTDYEYYDDSMEESDWQLNYGTPKPSSDVSSVQCGGCGALLHCKDSAIPGYLPSEIFLGKNKNDLMSITCQRCHFLKHYNTSLAVNVSPDEYPRLLSSIKSKIAAVILLVDLIDFPCSIWPDILPIIGTRRPIFVVGNKVDLLPRDSSRFFEHVNKCLYKAITESGIDRGNIKKVTLISAKTGYGVEDLINALHKYWEYKGHVYLIGCTNSGKSTLFNALLRSDYCKSQAVDLIQRATISPWPGTTLNLLKFPILRPSGWRLSMRAVRLQNEMARNRGREELRTQYLNETRNLKYAELIGHIGRTFSNDRPVESADLYSAGKGMGGHQQKFGVNINDEAYKESHWCYDTPGVVQPDQVLHLLTTDELMLTLPKRMIVPRTFCLAPKHSLFLGGLGRLDYDSGNCFTRFTVFASKELPVTVCLTKDADFIYDQLLTTEILVVPINDPERLKQWPELISKQLEITGVGWDVSAADVVLSSAGWIAVTPGPEKKISMKAWTPQGRGIYLRTPALLKHSVGLRGGKVRGLPVYYRGIPVYRKS